MNNDASIHLSIVATSRNDDHGENLLQRMQHFVDGFIIQCKRHQLNAELILVEWNPPADKKSLAEVLRFPEDTSPCSVRIITVPPQVHATLNHSSVLPLFQMIAKNVGVRRARGQYILATNIDILFSNAVMRFMRDKLESNILYRADRIDIPAQVTIYPENFDDTLRFCQQNPLRISKKIGTCYQAADGWKCFSKERRKNRLKKLCVLLGLPTKSDRASLPMLKNESLTSWGGRFLKTLFLRKVHANACGDFTLMARDQWFALRAYPEWPIFSMHLDSMLLCQAAYSGIKEIDLPADIPIYHIEHSMGSGYTPGEGGDQLFARLKARGIPYLDWQHVITEIKKMKKQQRKGQPILYNDDKWGFADYSFKETLI